MKIKQDTENWLREHNIEYSKIDYYDFGIEIFCKLQGKGKDSDTTVYRILKEEEGREKDYPFRLEEIYKNNIRAERVRVVVLRHHRQLQFAVYDSKGLIKWHDPKGSWDFINEEDVLFWLDKYGVYGRSI